MRNIKLIFLIFALIVLFLFGCQKQPDWPAEIMGSLWIPERAGEINRYILEGTYQVKYSMDVCYPARVLIDSMVEEMSKKGWMRMEYDIFNPKIKLNHATIEGWSDFVDKQGKGKILQWIDDWMDNQKNFVRYWLKYKTNTSEVPCKVEVIGIYIPAEAIRKQAK